MAGLDLDLNRVKGRPLQLAIAGWGISLAVALTAAMLLRIVPLVHAPLLIALALTTTAMGTFMPALHDAGKVLAAGAAGNHAAPSSNTLQSISEQCCRAGSSPHQTADTADAWVQTN